MAKDKPLIYCVLEPLGGSAEDYRAYDPAGERTVVLHFLEAGDPEALDRIEREALAAASISHPTLCRVFDVAEHCGRPFVVRDYVEEGQSLRARAAGSPLPWGEILEHAFEITAAIEAMHSTVILHRHISAATIFLNEQGHPKLAGFAFAPCRGQQPDESATAPEQKEGAAGDMRSDLYALGAVLYAMAAGFPPPPGAARPLGELRHDLPPAFAALVRILLEADPAQRFQSAEGIMRALTILRRGRGSVEVMERLRNLDAARKHRHRIRRRDERMRKRIRRVQVGGTILAVAAFSYLIWLVLPQYFLYDRLVERPLTSGGEVVDAAISPDGHTFAQVRARDGWYSIWRFDRSRGATVPVLAPSREPRRDLAFSADGENLHYVEGDTDNASLFAVALTGGTPQRVLSHIRTAVISPDGTRAASIRSTPMEYSVIASKADGSAERVVMTRRSPGYPNALAWRADNRTLAVSMFGEGIGANLFVLDVENGNSGQLGWHLWHGAISFAWLPAGDGLVVAGAEPGGASPLWRVSYPDGTAIRLTKGPNIYSRISLSADGRHMTALETRLLSSIWVAPGGDSAQAQRISDGTHPDGVGGMAWTPDGKIVFPSSDGNSRGLWIMDADGSQRKPVLTGSDFASSPAVTPDGRSIAFLWYSGGSPKIWAVGADGRNVRPITRGGGEFLPSFSPDGRFLYFVSAVPGMNGVWRMEYENGFPFQVARIRALFAALSPDGKLVAYRTDPPDGSSEVIVTTADGQSIAGRFPIKEFTQIGWTRESDAIVWPRVENGAGNLWMHRVSGGEARPITNFTEGNLFSFAWSRDYRRLAVARGSIRTDVVLVNDARW